VPNNKVMSTQQLDVMALKARNAQLMHAASKEFIRSLHPSGVHVVDTHVCFDDHVRVSALFMPASGDEAKAKAAMIDLLIEDFNALPTYDDVMDQVEAAERSAE
jgi:hypothetical protein